MEHSLPPHRLSLDPDFFRAHALAVLSDWRTRLRGVAATSPDGERTIVEAVPPPHVELRKGELFMNTVGREIARCDRAIAEIEAQRP